ncbi:DUF6705 family protein [Lacinutrix iliipiscaria]|uniref:DUF6705 family protein n=1 Tax=Lacinutrix iliipiscaria TaxID=1230532 RepID=A0ABW5WQI5_9FLAO
MKQIAFFIVLLLSFLSSKGQTIIMDIDDRETELVDGAYLKDVYNELDKFVGTWNYTNGNTSLTITFQKKIQVESRYFRDLLVGEYQYIEDGIEKINTLSNFDIQDDLESLYQHNLIGSIIIYKYDFPGCSNCDTTEKRVQINFSDPTLGLEHIGGMAMGLRYINDLIPKIQIDFARSGTMILPDGAPQEPTIPFGRYVLIQQQN